MNKKTQYKVITFSFIIFIFTAFIALVVTEKESFSAAENRPLQKFPKFSFQELTDGDWTKDFETYLNDHMPLRTFFVGAKAEVQKVLGYKEIGGAYIGEDDYIFQKIDVTDENMSESLAVFYEFANENKDKNVVISVVPSASHVLSDKMPEYANVYDETSFQQFAEELLKDEYVDLTDALKGNEDIYYRTDHHWTSNGAYIGFKEIAKELNLSIVDDYNVTKVSDGFLGTTYSKSCFFGVRADDILRYDLVGYDIPYTMYIKETDETLNSVYFKENLKVKDQYTYFMGHNRALIQIETGNNTGKEITVIKDSIANSFIPFLIPYYDKINVVDLRFYTEDIEILTANSDDVLILYYVQALQDSTHIKRLIS